jgi:hypothetical protein
MQQKPEAVSFPLLDRLMPEIGHPSLLGKWEHDFPRFVKTHRRYLPVFGRCLSVGLVREPRDVMVSYFKYATRRDHPIFQGSFSAFLRSRKYGLEAWFQHTASWLDKWTVWLTYENLRENPLEQVQRTLGEIGIQPDLFILRRAVEKSNLQKVRQVEQAAPPPGFEQDRAFKFTGTGRSSQWVDLFSDEDLDHYRRLEAQYEDLMDRLGFREGVSAQ